MQKKKKKYNGKKMITAIVACGVLLACAAVIPFILSNTSIEGQWERVDMRPTARMLEGLSTDEAEALYAELRSTIEFESMEMQLNENGLGTMIVSRHGITENTSFEWVAEDGTLTLRVSIPFPTEIVMEYGITRMNSRLTLTHEGEGVIELERKN